MLRRILKSFFVILIIFILFLSIRLTSFAQIYGPFKDARVNSDNLDLPGTDCTGSCSTQVFSNDCSQFDAIDPFSHHNFVNPKNGYECAQLWNPAATCIATNYQYASGPSYTCTRAGFAYDVSPGDKSGIQFYIPAPTDCSATYGGTCEFITDCTSPSMSYSNTSCNNPNGSNSLPNFMTCCVAPAPQCSDYGNCGDCVVGAPHTCGWNGSSCQNGTSSCPAGATQWNWYDCSTNECPVPTPTPIPCSVSGGVCTDWAGNWRNSCDYKDSATYTTYSCLSNSCSPTNYTCPSGQTCAGADDYLVCIAPTPTLTPTPGPKVTVQGRNVDANGNTLTANIGQLITLSNGLTNNSLGAWDFSRIAPGTYTVTANIPSGYTVSHIYSINSSPPGGSDIPSNSVTVSLPNDNDYADIYFKYTPPCQVTTSPGVCNLAIGGTCPVTASVTSGLGTAAIMQMRFGSYNTAVATVAPAVDSGSPYQTTATGIANGTTAVWGTADLDDNGDGIHDSRDRTCQSTSATDTDINVSGPGPTPTPGPTSPPATPTPTPISGLTPTPTPSVSYSVSGKLFNDVNGDGKSVGEANYTGTFLVSLPGGTVSYPGPAGSYSVSNLASGQYTITFSGLAAGYRFTYPSSSLIVNVGSSCQYPITSEAACTTGDTGNNCTSSGAGCSGSITNLNAGVTDITQAWFQSVGSDLRWDSGFNNPLPSSSTYASVPGTGGMPGIIFSGASTPDFGSGQASQNPFNWKVGSFANPEIFTQTHNLIPTSYRFLLETAEGSGITPIAITSLDGLTHGIYKAEGDLNLSGSDYTFALGNFIILINGNLNINQRIKVPVGSTVIFSAKGNITVNRALGEAASSTVPTIEGLYSADNNFIADGQKSCPTSDLRLNVAGTVIANAGRPLTSGTFINNRTLCADNSSYPAVSFTERPDFILNYPSFAGYIPRYWREVAP